MTMTVKSGAAVAGHEPDGQATKYELYLQSEGWAAKRLEVLSRAQWRCQACGVHSSKASLDVHHNSYKRAGKPGEMADTIALCGPCHRLFHERNAR